MRPFLKLSSYMKIVSNLNTIHCFRKESFDFDGSLKWKPMVMASNISLKTAEIVMYDRFNREMEYLR